jgi:predicted  nucleic acid-binding Zn-ribbon protein
MFGVLLQSPEEMAAAEKELCAATAELTAVRTKKNALITEQKEIEKALPKLATRISKLQMELTSFVALKVRVAPYPLLLLWWFGIGKRLCLQ